jgi:hypothetical protein
MSLSSTESTRRIAIAGELNWLFSLTACTWRWRLYNPLKRREHLWNTAASYPKRPEYHELKLFVIICTFVNKMLEHVTDWPTDRPTG